MYTKYIIFFKISVSVYLVSVLVVVNACIDSNFVLFLYKPIFEKYEII